MKLYPPSLPALPTYTLCRQCFDGVAAKPGQPGYKEWARGHACSTPIKGVAPDEHEALAMLLAVAPLRAEGGC